MLVLSVNGINRIVKGLPRHPALVDKFTDGKGRWFSMPNGMISESAKDLPEDRYVAVPEEFL